MKQKLLLLLVLTVFTLIMVPASHAGIYVGIGGPGYPYHHDGWCSRQAIVLGGPVYYTDPGVVYATPPPVVYTTPPPVVVQPTTPPSSVPYGFIQTGGILKSPYSDFKIGIGGKSSGDVVYDANNGKPFKVP